ncbi:Arginine repressor [Koleobacter methoxysyntrophicus]|jgi:transcriptional regulator of arginine metabolism|uniref:Arginine repressor n=1 Tax=Koleobacter methoxysyntrophicus TaxID=2751313 RepID=A0A8A0RRA8_9FIRM|nr:arginine repressor [Koleobacter methoxysyntrophicus]MDI3540772.1 transcriptional regulator of arginine metabolism [Thermosediminibacterales bacterium]MDK2901426.1 transcriptional regulator of arginine metabolism [Thermosediminibacterales bacterium]NPV42444.1 arginine repressor [Bacillota bacterium]QSQ10058.1 Arginine repressor [Koleobacter methoxysyntrophicus]
MKANRHIKILEIIESKPIETQEELAEELKKQGFNVTQATVSRDIKELRLIKVLTENNRYKYALPEVQTNAVSEKLVRMFKESITGFDFSENLIVIKTLSGAANAAAAAIDGLHWKEIVGTIAGDDTILVIARSKAVVKDLLERFNNLMM